VHFGEAISSLLSSNIKYKSIRVFRSIEILEMNPPTPDIIIMDTLLLQERNFYKFQSYAHHNSQILFLAISMHNGIPSMADMIRQGFKGYISKTNIYEKLIPVIQSCITGKYNFHDHSDYS